MPRGRGAAAPGGAEHLFSGAARSISLRPVAGGYAAGLAVRDGVFYVLVRRPRRGSDAVLTIDRKTGRAKATWPLRGTSAAAVCAGDNALWVLSASKDRFLRKLSAAGKVVKTIRLRAKLRDELNGLAVKGDTFIFSVRAGGTSTVYRYRPVTWKIEKLFALPEAVHSLALHGGKLVAYQKRFDTYADHWLHVFDLETRERQALRFLNFAAFGLASDGRVLYALSRTVDGAAVRPFVVQEKQNVVFGDPAHRRVTMTFPFASLNPYPYTLLLWVSYPRNRPTQRVGNITLTPKPKKVVTDKFGNPWAHLRWNTVRGGRKATLRFDAVTLSAAYTLDKAAVLRKGDVPARILTPATAETECFDYSHAVVRAAARKIPDRKTLVAQVLAVRNHVNDALDVAGSSGPSTTASAFLAAGRGRCYGHTLAFAALARARGIPTRAVGAITLERPRQAAPPNHQASIHTWNQVYAPGTGWADIDAQLDDGADGRHGHRYVGFRSNKYFVTFVGDYARQNYRDVFAQRGWYQAAQWRCDRLRMADLRPGKVQVSWEPSANRSKEEPGQ